MQAKGSVGPGSRAPCGVGVAGAKVQFSVSRGLGEIEVDQKWHGRLRSQPETPPSQQPSLGSHRMFDLKCGHGVAVGRSYKKGAWVSA